jgi:hypothetical protein
LISLSNANAATSIAWDIIKKIDASKDTPPFIVDISTIDEYEDAKIIDMYITSKVLFSLKIPRYSETFQNIL